MLFPAYSLRDRLAVWECTASSRPTQSGSLRSSKAGSPTSGSRLLRSVLAFGTHGLL